MDKRSLAVVGLLALVTLSGCALLTGETLEFEAEPATVSADAVSAASYEEVGVEEEVVNRTFTVADQEREVSLTNWVASYERDLGLATSAAPGTVTVLSTPEISVAGQTVNPLGRMSDRELLETLLQEYDAVSGVEQQSTRTVTVLGEGTEVTTFASTVEYRGQEVDVTIHLTSMTHEGDVVVGVALHPEVMTPDQAGVDTMFEGIEHGGE